jgi:hypothetical protein
MYWANWVWANYTPSWCYGEDEATMEFISNAPGSGEDANYSFVLPADGIYTQGDFYSTLWLGGAVYDPGSLDSQAYLEFQFYPAPPEYTGSGSGPNDCLPNGSFYPDYTAGSNEWFACAVVWQVITSGSSTIENAAFAGPLNLEGTTSILVLHSNDQIYVNETGVAQSSLQPWEIAVTDGTSGTYGLVSLQNGSKVLSPYYSTAAKGNVLSWGAIQPGAISMAYEIGHSLNPAVPEGNTYYDGCYPGDGVCDSYWPGRWAQSGQIQFSLPVLGSAGNQTYPYDIGFGTPTEGEDWINGTSSIGHDLTDCTAPRWSSSINCLYPWYTYRSQFYSFDFGANNQTNDTHDYGNWYEFPAATPPNAVRFHAAPWGVLNSSVTPSFAQVEFNPIGGTSVVPVLSNGSVYHQFMEGPYWLNVSYPGCPMESTFVYLGAGGVYNAPIQLACPGLYNVTFTETGLPAHSQWSVTLGTFTFQSTGPSITFYEPNGTQSYSAESPVTGDPGYRYEARAPIGSIDVKAGPVLTEITYAAQYEFTALAVPVIAAAVIDPALGWLDPGTSVQVTVVPFPDWQFASWTGLGNGSYSGPANPATVTMNGPILETSFYTELYNVSFVESGLPPSTPWSVDVDGTFKSGAGPAISFELANGSYNYNISGPAKYSISPQTGSGKVRGADQNLPIQFTAIVLFGLSAIDLELITIVVVAVAIAVGVNVAYWLTHRKRPPAPPPPSAPPPSWLGPPSR